MRPGILSRGTGWWHTEWCGRRAGAALSLDDATALRDVRGDAAAAGVGGAGAREALRRHAHLRARMLAHGGATARSEEPTTAPMHALTHATPCSQASARSATCTFQFLRV